MALAACVGATTPEIVGMYACKTKKVTKSCPGYIELCRYLDLPTIEEMAIVDAKSLVRQWSLYEPSDFLWHVHNIPNLPHSPNVHYGVDAPKGTLLSDLYKLAQREVTVRYPQYHQSKANDTFKNLTRVEKSIISPDFIKDLHVSDDATQEIWELMNLGQPSSRETANTFWLMVRDKFNVLERYARLCKTLPVIELSSSEKRKNTEVSVQSKKPRFSISDCSSATPWRRATHSKELDICRVCGYYIEFKNRVELTCCGAKAHRNCVRNQTVGLDSGQYSCRDLTTYMKRGGRQNDITVKFSKPPTLTAEEKRAKRVAFYKEQLICAVCHKQIESDDPVLLRNHLVNQCASIPFDPLLVGNNKYKLSRRLAALSSIYKINDGVRVRQRVLEVSVPSFDGVIVSMDDVLSEGSGGRHNPSPISLSSDN